MQLLIVNRIFKRDHQNKVLLNKTNKIRVRISQLQEIVVRYNI